MTSLNLSLQAQDISEVSEMTTLLDVPAPVKYSFAKDNSNEVLMLFNGLFLFYKAFVSSQDGQACSFTPSCSMYGLQAVRKHGPILGVFNTFDRLSRCNSLSPEKYELDPHSHLLIDPVD